MNKIGGYNVSNLNIKNESIYDNTKVIAEKKDNKSEENIGDTVQIEQKNNVIINTKKAYDALKETCDEVGTVTRDGYTYGSMMFSFYTMMDYMESQGISVPNFELSGNNLNNDNYLGFVDKIKEFTKNLSSQYPNVVPDNFYDFCDLFKEKLLQNGCS
ncbi:hypothetical protein HBE96_07130 [Clostridium sp. P21]|uniref:Uncharacterized protein n=1 Tax=Clostridium muellerianum TaxID=2716538 RepID=A0A7Y0EFJ0_9CLOT|nr:hypothetical protein [Clostridium muellerianum]NMM62466.1 hypothetical protein [Clostridium muellerianum]